MLENKNQLEQKVEWLSIQLKQAQGNPGQAIVAGNFSEMSIYQRRLQSLKSSMSYYREKTEKLSNSYFKLLSQLKQDNESLKRQLLSNQRHIQVECTRLIQNFQENFEQNIQFYTEKIQEQQSKNCQY